MEENLLGYLLKALDPAAQREVEEQLRADRALRQRLELLRQALAPLAEDKDEFEPPPGLRHTTLARVAEYRCRDLPYVPAPPPSRATIPLRPWLRWPDALVAAAILLIILSLVPLVRYRLLHQHNLIACQNNLRQFHQGFITYAAHNHGQLPMVREQPPRHVAGMFVLMLTEQRSLGHEVSVACPSNGRLPPSVKTLEEIERLYAAGRFEDFRQQTKGLAGCYAYCLGYRDAAGQLRGLCLDPDLPENDRLPLMADRPPFDNKSLSLEGNSKNHGGRGQNILFVGGDVRYSTLRTAGVNGDDVYTNWKKRVDAGLRRVDTVLGAGSVELEKMPPD